MDLYARVNILGGKAVRLPRGSVADAIALDADPVERAKGWVGKGADRLHIVDLDAAAYGDYRNRPLIRELVAAVDVPVQVAGGARSPREVTSLFESGAWRVVMGTAAVEDQVMVWDLCREYPGRIVVGVDVKKDEEVVTKGWTNDTGRYLEEVLIEISAAGAAAVAIAEVGRDALEEPPNYDALRLALAIVDEPVIAAGGVRNLDDLRLLTTLEADGKRLGGVIVGREVTAGRFSIEEAASLSGSAPSGPWTVDELRSLGRQFESWRGSESGEVASFLDYLESGGG